MKDTLCKDLKANELLLSFLKRPAAKAEIVSRPKTPRPRGFRTLALGEQTALLNYYCRA